MRGLLILAAALWLIIAIPADGSWEGPMALIVLTAIVVSTLEQHARRGHTP